MKVNIAEILLVIAICLLANVLFVQCENKEESQLILKQADQERLETQSDDDVMVEPMFIKHLLNRERFDEANKRSFSDEINSFYFDSNEMMKRFDGNKRPFNPQSRWGKRFNQVARFNPQSR